MFRKQSLCGATECGDHVVLPDHDPRESLPAVSLHCAPGAVKHGGLLWGRAAMQMDVRETGSSRLPRHP